MKGLKYLMMIISSFLLFSCSEKDEDVSNVDIAPVLISSDPFDGEDNILKGERIINIKWFGLLL